MANLSSYLPGGIDPSAVTITGGTINGTAIGASTAAAGTFTTFTSTGIDDNATSTAITIDSSQNVGIGTVSPSGKLSIAGGTANDYTDGITLQKSGGNVYGIYPSTNNLEFRSITGNSHIATFDFSGNVGIGTASPNSRLTIAQGFDKIALNATTTQTASKIVFADSTTTDFYSVGCGSEGDDFVIYASSVGAERMRIDSSGNVGIGTASPNEKLVSTGAIRATGAATNISNADGALLDYAFGYARLTAGSAASSVGITFNTAVSGTSTERMRIDSAGNLLVGKTTDPTVGIGQYIKPTGETFHTVNNSYNTLHVYNVDASAFRFYVGQNGTVHATNTSISAISDASLKENVRDLDKGLDAVLALQPRRFDWKNGDGNDIMGFIAQEVEEVMPELIDEAQYNKDETKKSLKMGDMIPSMVKAIQEQQAMIEELKAEVAALKGA